MAGADNRNAGINRRMILALGAVALLGGCKIIPKGKPPPVTPPPVDTSTLPRDAGRHRVALLVPLSGTNAAVGQSIANATTQAILDTNAQNLRITTYDTSGGINAAAKAAVADGNRLILGPLSADEVAPVIAATRAARVPLITFGNDSAVAAPDVFVMGTVPGDSIGRTVDLARARGMTRFALLQPDGESGRRLQAAYAAAVQAAGGSLVQTQTYSRGNTSIISAAQRLSSRGGFDAVLIADGARAAAQAATQLKRGGAAGPRIIGLDSWSGEGVLGSTPALRGAWYSAVSDIRFKQFADGYQSRFGKRPYRVATLGYDSVLLTIRIARDWRPGTPFPVARLRDSGGFLGLDGPFRFGASGVVERALEVREARSGGVTIVSPAPERFRD